MANIAFDFLTESFLFDKRYIDNNYESVLSMKLELPVINKISLNDLISIRHDNGQAFHNFRTELSTKLLEVRGINDKEELKIKYVNEVKENCGYFLWKLNSKV